MNFTKRYRAIVLCLVVCATGVFLIEHQAAHPGKAVDMSGIPLVIGTWKGQDQIVDDLTIDILETPAILMRQYKNVEGRAVNLAIVYYKDARVALHLPESCYLGAGSTIIERNVEEITLADGDQFKANKLAFQDPDGDLMALYYFETSNERTYNYASMRWQRMLNKVQGRSNNGALVRFSIRTSRNLDSDLAHLEAFVKVMAPIITKQLFQE